MNESSPQERNSKTITSPEKAELYRQRWEAANVQLEDGEYAVQMVEHNPMYFITNHGRVFSVWGKGKPRELKQFMGLLKNHKCSQSSMKQLRVYLRVDKKKKTLKTSRLMNEYFDLPVFNPAGKTGTLDCHHIHRYEPEKGTVNNHSSNLQMVDPGIHMSVFNAVQNGVLTQEGMKLKNPKQFWKRLSEIDTDKAFAIVSDIDREGGHVVGVHGEELSEEQVRGILQDSKVQDFLCNVQRAAAEDYRRRTGKLMEEVSKHPEKYRVVDGIPVLKINNQKKGEKGNGRD